MVSEISRGFREDCFVFLGEFAKHESLDFRYFCHEWKKNNFQYIFHGRNTDVELVEFIGEALMIVKQIFLGARKLLVKVGAFYLLYALYFKQPVNLFCKIRVTIADWKELKRFVQSLSSDEISQRIAVIFWKLFLGNAFKFVQDDKEHGFDGFFVKGLHSHHYDDKAPESFKMIKDAQKEFKAMKSNTGLFTALDALEMGYNEMKESLDESESPSDKLAQSELMKSLHNDLDSLMALLSSEAPSRAEQLGSQPDDGATEDDMQQDELLVHENIGSKRSSIREKAFKRRVHKKDLQIAKASTSGQVGTSGRKLRPRATKKRDLNRTVLNNDALLEADSTGEDELIV